MRMLRRILGGLVVLVLVLLVGGYWYERPLLLTGTGYAAHNDCAVHRVAGRSDPAADLPSNPLVPYLSTSQTGTSSTTSLKGVLASQTAYYTEGFGCTIASDRPTFPAPAAVAPLSGTEALVRFGVGDSLPDPGIAAAVATAFGDNLSPAQKQRLGTRAILVVHKGQVIAERYADGFTEQTPQLGWSMTKSVASLLVGRLVAQGKVALTDDHLRPEWTDGRSAITVDNLLRMTSGLAWDETYDLGTPITQMLYREPDMAAYVAAQPLAHPVGTYDQYSSGSTTLLCSVLNDRAKEGPNLPRTQLFAPLGLTSAVLEPDATGNPVCSSYLWATPTDWATLGQFALDDGVVNGQHLLPEGWMKLTTTAKAVRHTEDPGYAAGWWSNTAADGSVVDPAMPKDAYSMNGHDGQRVVVVPSADLVIVRLGFSPDITGGSTGLGVSALTRDIVHLLS